MPSPLASQSPGNCTSVTLLDSDSFANAKLRECPEAMIPIMNEVDIFTTATGRQDETSASPQYSPQLSEEVELVRSLTPESERQIQGSPSPGPSPAPRTLPSFVVDDPYPSPSSSPSSPSPSPYPSPSPSSNPSPSPSPSSVGVILADNSAHAGDASYVGYPMELSSTGSAQLVEAIEQSLAANEAFVVYAPRGFVDRYLNPALQQVGRNLGASLGLSVTTSSNSPFGYETVVAKPFYALGGAGR